MSRSVSLALASALPVLLAGSASAESFDPWVDAARYELTYRADLGPVLAEAGASRVRVWMPLPRETRHQDVLAREITAPWPHRVAEDGLGNRLVYLEPEAGADGESAVTLRSRVRRRPSDGVRKADVRPGTPLDPERHLGGLRRIPLNGLIEQLAEQESRGLETDAQKIRAFYDYVYRTMTYSKKGEGWGHGDAIWACTEKYGNCTDFHSLFMGMARSQRIPARFVIGFPMPAARRQGEIPGYHCWAEVYHPERGWLPLDASEAKKAGRKDAYFGRIPSDRIEFTAGRDLRLDPPQDGAPLNYFVYPYVEVDGDRVDDVPLEVRFRRLPERTASR